MRNNFPKRSSGASCHTLFELYLTLVDGWLTSPFLSDKPGVVFQLPYYKCSRLRVGNEILFFVQQLNQYVRPGSCFKISFPDDRATFK